MRESVLTVHGSWIMLLTAYRIGIGGLDGKHQPLYVKSYSKTVCGYKALLGRGLKSTACSKNAR